MDELKLILNTKFMRSIITKLLGKAIYKKTGYQVDVQVNEVKAETRDGKIKVHMDVDAEMSSEDLMKALKSGGIL